MAMFETYKDAFPHIRLERQGGILEVTLHRDGGPAMWEASEGGIHWQLGEAFYRIGRDPENRVMILTGAGDAFLDAMDRSGPAAKLTPAFWDRITREGKDLLHNLLNIDIPVIGAVNGNAFIHAELIALSDIVLMAEGAAFADKAHAIHGAVPGDGVQVVWPMLLGPNRGRHFLLTGAEIGAEEALRLGVCAEVLPREVLRDRAWAIARDLAQKPVQMLRGTRSAFVQEFKRRLREDLGYGLALEGLAMRLAYE